MNSKQPPSDVPECIRQTLRQSLALTSINDHTDAPELNVGPDEESIAYIADEILSNMSLATRSPTHLQSFLSAHLMELSLCETDEECEGVCGRVYEVLKAEGSSNKEGGSADSDHDQNGPADEDSSSDEEEPDQSSIITSGLCTICDRSMPLTFHHLIPKKMHKKILKRHRTEFDKEELNKRGVLLCRPCHSAVHRIFTHEVLALERNTLDKLLESEEVQKWAGWASKQRGYAKDHMVRGLRHASSNGNVTYWRSAEARSNTVSGTWSGIVQTQKE
ncbi:hypothetical protein HK102_011745 [Quaeritorhiza haematococci]|nr:hypothetical protein HK102_011745 [Quaeritorhiza haematococci]